MIIWITGLSGAGKTTLAKNLMEHLSSKSTFFIHLDGDDMRNIIQDPHVGHDQASRLANAYRISRMAQYLQKQGCHLIVSTMSLFHEIHDWNRENMNPYFEILVQADLATRQKRDHKGLYAAYKSGKASHMPGLDISEELPKHPDLVLNSEVAGPEELCDQLTKKLIKTYPYLKFNK